MMWCLPSSRFSSTDTRKEKKVGFKIELSIVTKKGKYERICLRPSGCPPYVFATEEDAELCIRMAFADPAQYMRAKPRVVNTDEAVTHG
jgi:hypothetical protein